MRESRFSSTGVLNYGEQNSSPKLIVLVDPEITRYYRSLIPKWICPRLNQQMYAPHISVVRKELPPRMDLWGKYEGELIKFEYSNIIHQGGMYYWLNCYSQQLIEIRLELGLPEATSLTRPPDGEWCFHSTLCNIKGL